MDIEYLLNCDYEFLKKKILFGDETVISSLRDNRMKLKLINAKNKYELIWLAQDMSDESALILFDDKGIEILSKSQNLVDKMNGIMSCGKKYVDELLKKALFCELIINNFQELSSYIRSFEKEGAISLAKYVQSHNPDLLYKTLLWVSVRVQKDVISELDLSFDLKKKLVVTASGSAAEFLLKEDPSTIHLNDYNFNELLKLFSKKCTIPYMYLLDKEFIHKITTIMSVKDYRFLIDNLSKNNDITEITQRRKVYYNQEIFSFNAEHKMLERYYQCYLAIVQLMENNDVDYDKMDKIYQDYFNFFGSGNDEWNIKNKISEYIRLNDSEGLKEFLINESNFQLSNMIIDYHFEDIPFNFFLDIKQLIHFQQGEGRTLNDEDLNIYTKLLNIDNLSYEEKISLHKRLSQEDFVSKHYDLFREAKDKSASLIKEKMLTKQTVQQYYNQDLSLYCGVPVYVLEGQEFYAFVKALYSKTAPLTPSDMISTVDGGSYSLDGSSKLNTYRDPRTNYNLIFNDFPIDQVVHMYPVDSFSKYIRTSDSKATQRVNELYTPAELVERSRDYNEIILSQPNARRNDELNANLMLPTLLGLYCYDEITELDVMSAQNLGVGIVLVKTKFYDIDNSSRISMNDTLMIHCSQRYAEDINYLSNVTEDDMINRRKL